MRKDLFNRPLDQVRIPPSQYVRTHPSNSVESLIIVSSVRQVLLTDFFGNVQNIELTESKEKSSLRTEDIDSIDETESIVLDTAENENYTLTAQRPQQLPQGHTFEIGDPSQSQTWRYGVFVALSVALFGALVSSSFVF